MIGIYKITSPTRKVYIGQSTNIEKRFLAYKKINCKQQTILYNSLKKHGVDKHKFEILCECDTSELNEKERYYQDLYSVLNRKGLNCVLTKSSDRSGELRDEVKLKISLANKGKFFSEETRKKISLAGKGRKHSEETRKKMSESGKTKIFTKEHRAKIILNHVSGMLGKKASEETLAKMSIAHKGHKRNLGRKASEETKAKISEAQKGNNYCIKRKVLNTETNVLYNSIKEAAIIEKLKYTTLASMLKNKNPNKTKCILI
jgi:group I intron endonuclease